MQLPLEFLKSISEHPQLAHLGEALLTPPEVSVRLNQSKGVNASLDILAQDASLEKVAWHEGGYYLNQRPSFTFDPALHQGRYYVQDASSMALGTTVAELAEKLGSHPLLYLDACAAPGGKTTAALSALPQGSYVIANEYDYRRAEILAENVAKWGNPNVAVSRGDTMKFQKVKKAFDIIAVDAPCSGEGMMRKDDKAVEQWSPSLVKQCADTQREILENVWESLRPGGYLIYSTCTFNLQENEGNVQWLIDALGAESVAIESLAKHEQIASGIGTANHCYRFMPGRTRGEGLFLAAVRKPGTYAAYALKPTASKPLKQAIDLSEWLSPSQAWAVQIVGEEAYAMPSEWAPAVVNILKCLNVVSPGLHIATIKGKAAIPTQELALCTKIHPEAFPRHEVNYDDAIKYLQKEAFALDDAPMGYVLLTYQGCPLGFVKNLGNRANNLYPKSWRILSKR